MSALSWRTERCAPRRSFLLVSSANQRSTRFSHDATRRREVQDEPRVAVSHFWIAGVLWVALLSRTRCTSRSAGTSRSMVCRNCLNSIARWRLCSAPMTLPVRDIQRREQARRAVALVVVRRALGHARQHRQDRRGAVQRLDLGLLVDAQHHRALGRVEIEPDDVADLVDELRVPGQLPRLLRDAAAARTPARSACTAVCVSPTSAAIDRVDQCVASFGVALQRLGDHRLDLRVGHRPRPTRARLVDQPVQPLARRTGAATCATVLRVHARAAAAISALSAAPRPTSKTIRERSASACALVRRRDHDSNCSRRWPPR